MANKKHNVKKLEPFTCQKCGETKMLPYHKSRLFCLECAALAKREQTREWDKRVREKQKQERVNRVATNLTEDMSLDERIKAQVQKQCKRCFYWSIPHSTGGDACCSYYLRHGVGHRVDHGNGPGDCRSFEPRRTITKEERVELARKGLALSEADAAIRKGSVD